MVDNVRNEQDILQEVRKAQAAYMREWRRKNPERQKAIMVRYWAKRLAQMQQEQTEREEGDHDA